jgi:hypothetical protein
MKKMEWMRADALRQLKPLQAGDELVGRTTPSGEVVDGTSEQIGKLREEIRQIEEAIRVERLH